MVRHRFVLCGPLVLLKIIVVMSHTTVWRKLKSVWPLNGRTNNLVDTIVIEYSNQTYASLNDKAVELMPLECFQTNLAMQRQKKKIK